MNILRTLLSWLGLTASAAVWFPSAASSEPVLVATPDTPVNFGYKVNWFAVKTEQPTLVAQTLNLTNRRQANWKTGIEAGYARAEAGDSHSRVFVSPPVGGWVFVVGSDLPLPDLRDSNPKQTAGIDHRFEQLFGALSKAFPEVQFFASYRVVGLDGWARARGGRVERNFLIVDGEVYANVGAQTVEERQLKFLDLSGLSPARAGQAIFANAEQRNAQEEHLIAKGIDPQEVRRQLQQVQRDPIPNEEDTMAIAGAWGINPSSLEDRKMPRSAGLVGQLPRN
jgi:hypothetical protein